MEDNKLIGSRIKQRREQLNLTQEDLGTHLSLNKSTINRYESGEVQKIKIPILHALAKFLDVDPNWLALKTDEMGSFPKALGESNDSNIKSAPITEDALSESEMDLIKLFRLVPEESRPLVLSMIKAALKNL